jgi:hypothetical protein
VTNDGEGSVLPVGVSIGPAEQFAVELDTIGGYLHLRSIANGKYLTCEGSTPYANGSSLEASGNFWLLTDVWGGPQMSQLGCYMGRPGYSQPDTYSEMMEWQLQ